MGAHYTTEKNILKVIEPLFMDDLRAEFGRLKSRKDGRRRPALLAFQEKLGQLRFFDPACGCGNFLIIAYRELRTLEIEVLKEIYAGGLFDKLGESLSVIDVDQFYGIEIGEFPARIAETALWMMDHIMNNRLSLAIGQAYARIPLEASPHIVHGDALETDWAEVLAPEDCSFVFGNPPFVGAKFQTPEQRAQVRRIAALGKTGGTLDYVTAWFITAGEYVKTGQARIGFVATNSITQGEQVAQLWPVLFNRCKLEIAFAHRTFAWGSDARGKAHVHVVILGLDRREATRADKRLFSYPDINGEPEETTHSALSPYLFDAGRLADPYLTVREEGRPINGMGKLIIGSKPIDGGHYIFDAKERATFLEDEPGAAPFLRPFIGAREYLQGGSRWILTLHDVAPDTLARLPRVRERITAVRSYRQVSKSRPTQELAKTPTLYHVNVLPTSSFLVIPEVSSERREYAPIGWLEPPVIPSNKLRVLSDASLADFALLTSAMHMAWMRAVAGRLEEPTTCTPLASSTTPSRCRREAPISRNWSRWRRRSSTPAPPIPTRRWPTSTTATSCRPTCGERIRRSTARWTGSIARAASPPSANASSTSSCSTRRCARLSKPARRADRNDVRAGKPSAPRLFVEPLSRNSAPLSRALCATRWAWCRTRSVRSGARLSVLGASRDN